MRSAQSDHSGRAERRRSTRFESPANTISIGDLVLARDSTSSTNAFGDDWRRDARNCPFCVQRAASGALQNA